MVVRKPAIEGKVLLKTIFKTGGIKLISLLTGFILSIILAEKLGMSGYGEYTFTVTVVMLLAMPITTGLPTYIVRQVSFCFVNNDWNGVSSLIIKSAKLALYIYIISIFIVMLNYTVFNFYSNKLKQFHHCEDIFNKRNI